MNKTVTENKAGITSTWIRDISKDALLKLIIYSISVYSTVTHTFNLAPQDFNLN